MKANSGQYQTEHIFLIIYILIKPCPKFFTALINLNIKQHTQYTTSTLITFPRLKELTIYWGLCRSFTSMR